VSAFANYEGLALLDSFTVIGHDNYVEFSDTNPNYYLHHTWNRIYFGIYVYNLFVRYSLFKFNAQFLSNPVKYRDKFQDYLNHYNFKHIAFNFLPNLIFDKIRVALGIEDEIETFEKRLGNLAASIQEQQEKRQAFLLKSSSSTRLAGCPILSYVGSPHNRCRCIPGEVSFPSFSGKNRT
jgi:hypothetical protein